MLYKSSDERGDLKTISFVAGTSKYFTSHIKRILKKSFFMSCFLFQNSILGNDPLGKNKTMLNPCENRPFEFP